MKKSLKDKKKLENNSFVLDKLPDRLTLKEKTLGPTQTSFVKKFIIFCSDLH